MASILDQIVSAKTVELEEQKGRVSLKDLEARIQGRPAALDLAGELVGDRVRLIGEVKKASPSRGLLAPSFDPVALAQTYVLNGAAAVSVLTDPRFQGEPRHLELVKEAIADHRVPVLRKDFIFDPYQVFEARAWGADALLLIAAILSTQQMSDLLSLSQELGLQALVEVHGEGELEMAVEAGAEIIGINNRDLRTFETDLSVTERLAPQAPGGKVLVSESGVFTGEDVARLRDVKVNAVLVGEALVTAPDVGAKVRELAQAAATRV